MVLMGLLQLITPTAPAWCFNIEDAVEGYERKQNAPGFMLDVRNKPMSKIWYLLPISANLLDAHSTLRVINKGGRELNPYMEPLTKNPILFYGIKAGLGLGSGVLAREMSKHSKPVGFIGLTIGTGVPLGLAIHNYGL